MLTITLLGTGSPMPDPNRAGPATLISTDGDEHFLVDAGRGVLMRLAATGVGVDRLSTDADALVHTVIRKDIIENIPLQRMVDTLDYHSSPAEAAQTAKRGGVGTLVLTHYVPTFRPGGGDDWRALAAEHFDGTIEVGDDLHRIEINPRG